MDLNTLEQPSEGPETLPPLVMAHGLFGSARNFNTLGRKLAAGRRVILVDMPNHGESPWTEDVSYTAMADALASVLVRAGERAVLLGHSMGGKAAMTLALARPELLVGLIVADIAPVAYEHTHAPYIDAMMSVDLSRIERRSQADPLLATAIESPMLRAFLLQNLVFEDGSARWRINLAALKAGMPKLIGWPGVDGSVYDGPTVFIYGGASDYMSPAHQGIVRQMFPMADFDEIAGAGHWLHAEKPAEFLAAVQGWLAARQT